MLDECEIESVGTRCILRVAAAQQAKRVTKARAQCGSAAFLGTSDEKRFSRSLDPQEIHRSSTGFAQRPRLTLFSARTTLETSCTVERWRGSLAVTFLLACSHPTLAADDATLLRVFLTDGTSLVSYGEPARVGDRVIFSMPTATTPNPPLHLIDMAASRVDWDRTNRYAAAAREAHYIETQADLDYAALSNRVAQALNDLTQSGTPPAGWRSPRTRGRCWPPGRRSHYNYRQADLRQMLLLLDEAIADLRAATGQGRFDLSLSTFTDPPAVPVSLLPPPTPKDAIEQVLLAARLADTAAERTSLLGTALAGLNRDAAVLPFRPGWRRRAPRRRRALTPKCSWTARIRPSPTRTMVVATRRARAADVRGSSGWSTAFTARSGAWQPAPGDGRRARGRYSGQLDAARRLQLARDRWALRVADFRRYRVAIEAPLYRFAALKPALERIKSLAGNSAPSLAALDRGVSQILKQAGTIAPPAELRSAHALLVSAVQLAGNAARIRAEATLAGDIARAWDASSAAAGALMLGARAEAIFRSCSADPNSGDHASSDAARARPRSARIPPRIVGLSLAGEPRAAVVARRPCSDDGAARQLRRTLGGERDAGPCDARRVLCAASRATGRPAAAPDRLRPRCHGAVRRARGLLPARSLGVWRLRPGLIAEILRFYDQLRRQARNVARFEELLEEALSKDAEHDRGAERMLAQTRFLTAAFRGYEQRVRASGACDEHVLRERLIAEPSSHPVRDIVVTVGDWIADPSGLLSGRLRSRHQAARRRNDRRRGHRRTAGVGLPSAYS